MLAARTLATRPGYDLPAVADRAPRDREKSQTLDFSIITEPSSFAALEPEWNDLFDRVASGAQIFQGFNWLWHWSNHFLTNKGRGALRLAIVTGRRNGRLELVWPLAAKQRGPLTVLTWMGEPVSQYGDILVERGPDTAEMLHDAFSFICTRLDASLIQLRKVRADSPLAPLLPNLGAIALARHTAPYLDLAEARGFDDYEKRYSSSDRKNRRRQRRRFEERGQAAFIHLTNGEEARRLATVAIDLKRVWLESRRLVSPAIADTRTQAFFADVAEAATRPAGCRVLALTSNGTPAAVEISLVAKGHAAIHIIAYDADFEKAAVGSLLMEDSIRRAYADGCRTFDLMAPGDAYKLDWADKQIEVVDWALPLSSLGQAYAIGYLKVLRGLGKQAVTHLPSSLRHTLDSALAVMQGRRLPG